MGWRQRRGFFRPHKAFGGFVCIDVLLVTLFKVLLLLGSVPDEAMKADISVLQLPGAVSCESSMYAYVLRVAEGNEETTPPTGASSVPSSVR